MADSENITEWLAEHPRMMGALWMMMLILSQTGSALAGAGNAKAGP